MSPAESDRRRPARALALLLLWPFLAPAQTTLYTDFNGTAAGYGTTASFTWGTGTAQWTTSTAGTTTPVAWTNGATAGNAVLGSGGGATAYTATLGSAVSVGTISVGGGVWSIATAGNALTFNSAASWTNPLVISGSGSVTQSGSGTLTLSGANSYSGATAVSAGVLSVADLTAPANGPQSSRVSSIGNSGSAVVLGAATTAGTLSYTGAADTYTRGFTVNAGGGVLANVGSGVLTVSTGGIATAGVFTVDGTQDTTITSAISGAGSLAKTGSGVLTLGGASTFSGGTSLNGGTLALAPTSLLAGSALTLNGGTLLLSGAGTFSFGAITVTGSTTIDFGAAGATSLSSSSLNIANNARITVANWVAGSDQWIATSAPTINGTAVGSGVPISSSNIEFSGNAQTAQWNAPGYANQIAPVPEPAAYGAMLAAGCLGVALRRRRTARETAPGPHRRAEASRPVAGG